MSRTGNTLLFTLVFVLLKLAVDIFQASYYGLGLNWPAVIFGAAAVTLAGAAGHFTGLAVLGRPLQRRAVPFIAIISFFTSVSLAYLLPSVVTTLPVFLAGVVAITFVVTVWIGPRWD